MPPLHGLATGIGSMPHMRADPALELIFSNMPYIPHWPQLPAAGENEGFVRQFLAPLIERRLIADKRESPLFFAAEDAAFSEKMADYNLDIQAAENSNSFCAFALPVSYASGFFAYKRRLEKYGTGSACYLKGQISGPISVGLQITDTKTQSAIYRAELRDLLVKTLAHQARWQIRELFGFGLPVLFFIDDPSLCVYGQSPFSALSESMIKESLIAVVNAARAEGARVGVHACAGINWSLLFDLPLDVVNIDAYHYFASVLPYASDLNDYLARGNTIAWGLVPTSPAVEKETAQTLLDRLSANFEHLESIGVDGRSLRKQLLFTPACGTGTLTKHQAEWVYRLLREVSETYQRP